MSSLKERLETHPIRNLNAVIKSIKSEIAPKLALSKDRKRHSKAKLIEHILLLDKMGLLKQDIPSYNTPKKEKAPKEKAPPKPKKEKSPGAKEAERIKKKVEKEKKDKSIKIDLEKAKKSGIKIDKEKAKKAGVILINAPPKPKKEKAPPKPKAPKKDTYTEAMKPLFKEQKELLKLLDDNKDKLKKIDTFKIGSRGKVKDGNFYDENRLSVNSQILYGTPAEAKKRLEFYSKKIKKELAKAKAPPKAKASKGSIPSELPSELSKGKQYAKNLKKRYTDHKKDLGDMSNKEIIAFIKQDIKREELNLKEIKRLLKDATDKEAFSKSSFVDRNAIKAALKLYNDDLKEVEKKPAPAKKEKAPAKTESKGFRVEKALDPKSIAKPSAAIQKANEMARKRKEKEKVENEKKEVVVKQLLKEIEKLIKGNSLLKKKYADALTSNNPTYLESQIKKIKQDIKKK